MLLDEHGTGESAGAISEVNFGARGNARFVDLDILAVGPVVG